MRGLTIVVVCALLVSGTFALAGKPVVEGPLGPFEEYAKLTAKAKAIRLEITVKFVDKESDVTGSWNLLGEKKARRYVFESRMTERRPDRVSTLSGGCIHTAEGTVMWTERDGQIVNASRRKQPKNAKLPAYVEYLGPLSLIYDGLHGYKLAAKKLTLKPERPPHHEKDGLKWYLVEEVKHKEKTAFQKAMHLELFSLWLGFSPKDGWIHGLVLKEKLGNSLSVCKVTKIDLKPKLKGAFDVPADVEAKLDEEKMKREVAPAKRRK